GAGRVDQGANRAPHPIRQRLGPLQRGSGRAARRLVQATDRVDRAQRPERERRGDQRRLRPSADDPGEAERALRGQPHADRAPGPRSAWQKAAKPCQKPAVKKRPSPATKPFLIYMAIRTYTYIGMVRERGGETDTPPLRKRLICRKSLTPLQERDSRGSSIVP